MPQSRIGVLLFSFVLLFAGNPNTSLAQSEQEAILKVVSSVFDGINSKDGALIQSALAPESILYATGKRNGDVFARASTGQQFAEDVSSGSDTYVERMFETEVKVHEGIATVWANYDFHVNGTFSHCGVDTFTLVKMPTGWKVASLVYTVEQTGCVERPSIPSK